MQKKTRKDDPGGFVDNVQTLLLAGTVAIRTHVPLARHVFYVFFHIGQADKLALHVDVRKIHRRSKTDLTPQVKSTRAESWSRLPMLTTLRFDIWPVPHVLRGIQAVSRPPAGAQALCR